jgi:peptidoglycan/LPS O-acetylase OafA/YrhL
MSDVNPRFPLFDSLRAIAALSVFADHLPVTIHTLAASPLRPYFAQLNVGVSVFFLTSGFLLYRPFARARYRREESPAVVPYAIRRVLRIGPAYWVALPLTALLVAKSDVFTTHAFAYFGFLQVYDSDTLLGGISAAWTLCVEVAFYAMLPLWALLLMRRVSFSSRRAFVRTELIGLAALYAAGLAWTSVAATGEHLTPSVLFAVTQIPPWLYVLPSFLDQFALGMALAVISVAAADRSRRSGAIELVDRAPWLPWLAAAIAFFLLAHIESVFPAFGPQAIAQHLLQGVVAFALLLPAVFGDPDRGLVRKVLANRVLLWIGLVSYGLYLWHAAILLKLADMGAIGTLGSFGYVLVALGLSLLAAAASFYLIERPALRLGRRLLHRGRAEDADVRMRDLRYHERPQPGT